MKGSVIASIALLLWVPISLLAFKFLRPSRAAAILLLGAVMFLPEREQFAIPAIPPFTKLTICSICVFIGVFFTSRRKLIKTPWPRPVRYLLWLMAAGIVGTIATNLDAVECGLDFCKALLPHTTVTFLLDFFLSQVVPFWVGLVLFRTRRELREGLRIVAGAGLLYSLLVIVEVRLSPQLHSWIYGYIQHDWLQTIRQGGFRPMVFMAHGLSLGLLMATCAVAAMGLFKARLKIFGINAAIPAIYLLVILVLCRSIAALIYGAFCILLIAFTSARTQVRVAVILCAIAVVYPVLRAVDIFPDKQLVDLSTSVSVDRGASLGFRFFNEDILLEKAIKRPLFGWGGFDRIRIYDEESGEDISVTDGYWIIIFASRGVVGFVAVFGLLVFPVFTAYRRIDRVRDEATRALVACLALLATINIVDLIPNGLFTYLPFFYSGSLLGVIQRLYALGAPIRPSRRSARAHQPIGPVPISPADNIPPVHEAYR